MKSFVFSQLHKRLTWNQIYVTLMIALEHTDKMSFSCYGGYSVVCLVRV